MVMVRIDAKWKNANWLRVNGVYLIDVLDLFDLYERIGGQTVVTDRFLDPSLYYFGGVKAASHSQGVDNRSLHVGLKTFTGVSNWYVVVTRVSQQDQCNENEQKLNARASSFRVAICRIRIHRVTPHFRVGLRGADQSMITDRMAMEMADFGMSFSGTITGLPIPLSRIQPSPLSEAFLSNFMAWRIESSFIPAVFGKLPARCKTSFNDFSSF